MTVWLLKETLFILGSLVAIIAGTIFVVDKTESSKIEKISVTCGVLNSLVALVMYVLISVSSLPNPGGTLTGLTALLVFLVIVYFVYTTGFTWAVSFEYLSKRLFSPNRLVRKLVGVTGLASFLLTYFLLGLEIK